MAVVLGLDIGTTSTIGILIDTASRTTLATSSRPVRLYSEHPGWAEEDPAEWWANTAAICRELTETTGRVPEAIGVTGMLPAVVLLDAEGRNLRRSIQQSDGRTGAEVAELAAEIDEPAFLARTGQGVSQQLVAAKLRWLGKHEPETVAATATLFGSYDYIVWRLTGQRSLEQNWALESGFYDLATADLADDLVALGGLRRDQLPPVRRSSEIVGCVTPEAAAATGLPAGTPVVAGCADHIASAYVAGVTGPGDCLIKFGGAGDIMLATAEPKPDPRLFLDFHIMPGLFMPNGCMACSGALLNWFVAELGGGRSHAELDRLAEKVPPGCDGLVCLPYFLGEKTPIQDPAARGVFMGLTLAHGAGHLWRALLEAVVFGFRHHIEVARELGYPVTRVLASDGGTASAVWMQIAADALGQPVQLLTGHPGSCLGAAWVAAMGTGLADDWAGVQDYVGQGRTVRPDPATAAAYGGAYRLYRDGYLALKPLFRG
ncbi:MAG: FGGY-family carbohydrate kinase [Geminicoccaceae bacterium]